jgi:hypothetical protein
VYAIGEGTQTTENNGAVIERKELDEVIPLAFSWFQWIRLACGAPIVLK